MPFETGETVLYCVQGTDRLVTIVTLPDQDGFAVVDTGTQPNIPVHISHLRRIQPEFEIAGPDHAITAQELVQWLTVADVQQRQIQGCIANLKRAAREVEDGTRLPNSPLEAAEREVLRGLYQAHRQHMQSIAKAFGRRAE